MNQCLTQGEWMGSKVPLVYKLRPEDPSGADLHRNEPSQLMAIAFRDLAGNAAKIGQLNVTPDLLREMLQRQVSR
jgi:hypothetical protein